MLIGGCATNGAYLEARKLYEELNCEGYDLVNMPGYAEYFDAEPIPEHCLNMLRRSWALTGMQRVTIYDAETGSTRSAIVPAGTVVVK